MRLIIRPVAYSENVFAAILADAPRDGPFLLRLQDEWENDVLRFDRPGETLLGVFAGSELVGVGGISLDPYAPEDGLGRVRHVYVLRAWRGRGLGRRLVAALVEHARGRFDRLRLSTRTDVAARLYESFGFERCEAEKQSHQLSLGGPLQA